MVTSLEIALWNSHVTPSCNAGRHCPMVQLLHENCQQPTVDADGCLPSKSVYLVHAPEEDLFWTLDDLHDRLKLWGEKRTLYKWRTFVAESLQKCVLVSWSFVCHLHFSGRDLPPSALDDNVASTRAVLTYLFTIMETGRKDDMVQQVFQLLCRICNRVCETFCHDSPGYKMDLMLDDESRLEVCAQSGLVGGMQDFVSAKHRTDWQAWAKLGPSFLGGYVLCWTLECWCGWCSPAAAIERRLALCFRSRPLSTEAARQSLESWISFRCCSDFTSKGHHQLFVPGPVSLRHWPVSVRTWCIQQKPFLPDRKGEAARLQCLWMQSGICWSMQVRQVYQPERRLRWSGPDPDSLRQAVVMRTVLTRGFGAAKSSMTRGPLTASPERTITIYVRMAVPTLERMCWYLWYGAIRTTQLFCLLFKRSFPVMLFVLRSWTSQAWLRSSPRTWWLNQHSGKQLFFSPSDVLVSWSLCPPIADLLFYFVLVLVLWLELTETLYLSSASPASLGNFLKITMCLRIM